MFKFKDEEKRSKLCEGRNYGMGFALCRRENNNIITEMPISPCRDFLNDKVFSENTGKPFSIYGLNTEKTGAWDNQKFAYLAFKICKKGRNDDGDYENYKRDKDTLDNNWQNLALFINKFEDKLKLAEKTTIFKIKDGLFIAELPVFWVQYTYLISLYSLLMRDGFFYDGKKDIIQYLKDFSEDYEDKYLINSAFSNIEKILNGNIPKQDFSKGGTIHHIGIVGFHFDKFSIKEKDGGQNKLDEIKPKSLEKISKIVKTKKRQIKTKKELDTNIKIFNSKNENVDLDAIWS